MASGQTQYYGLSQWEAADKLERVDFNSDNAKIDGALRALAEQAGRKADKSTVTNLSSVVSQKADETALFQIINQLSPLVIVDESHHARSELSLEMLKNFNPCFVLDLTATPKKESNIISYVDAVQLKKENMLANRPLLEVLSDMAARKHATNAQISLAWMLCKKPYIVPIPGSRKVERMWENAGAAEVVLSPAEVEALDNALDTIPMSAVFGGTAVKSR